jgi:hypothetical protein
LRTAGKQAIILNPTAISRNYRFLDPAEEVNVFPEEGTLGSYDFDAVFVLDISRWERLGNLAEPIRFCNKPKVCVDHHPYSGGYADFHLIDTAAQRGNYFDLLRQIIFRNDRIAECIYADDAMGALASNETPVHIRLFPNC